MRCFIAGCNTLPSGHLGIVRNDLFGDPFHTTCLELYFGAAFTLLQCLSPEQEEPTHPRHIIEVAYGMCPSYGPPAQHGLLPVMRTHIDIAVLW